jgi:hypothetical protein
MIIVWRLLRVDVGDPTVAVEVDASLKFLETAHDL